MSCYRKIFNLLNLLIFTYGSGGQPARPPLSAPAQPESVIGVTKLSLDIQRLIVSYLYEYVLEKTLPAQSNTTLMDICFSSAGTSVTALHIDQLKIKDKLWSSIGELFRLLQIQANIQFQQMSTLR